MENRIALIGIIIEDDSVSEQLQKILHDYSTYFIGRMGLPYKQKGIAIISLVVDASQQIISALTGKIGKLSGLTVKTMYAKQN